MASTGGGGGGMFFSFVFLLVFFFSPTDAAVFDIVNQCPYTIWPASLPGGGRQLGPGQRWSLYMNPGTSSGRIWGRTGCSFDGGGRGGCQTGDCGGALDCRLSGRPPATLAEFTLNGGGNNDYYDVSVIDGFNLPMYFGPTAGGCRGIRCDNAACPDAYHYPDQRATFGCPSGTNYRVVFCP